MTKIKFSEGNGFRQISYNNVVHYDVDEDLFNKFKECYKENKDLKKQLDYIRSGEYYNQIRFENEMLQQVVDTNGVPSEVYDFIDCTHRNTQLLEENQRLKEQLENNTKIQVADHKYASQKEDEVIVLQERIQKAIEYIKKYNLVNAENSKTDIDRYAMLVNAYELLEILEDGYENE